MKKWHAILSLCALSGSALFATQTARVAQDTPVAFDRTKLISLDQAVPASALAPQPDERRAVEQEAKLPKTVSYRVIDTSTVGGKQAVVTTLAGAQSIVSNGVNAQSLSSNTGTIVYEYTTADGNTLHIPVQVPMSSTATSGTQFYMPPKASYTIIGR